MTKYAFFIFGPQGSGKGTQAKFIAEAYKCEIIASGDIFRAIALGKSKHNEEVRSYIKQGKLLPDSLVNRTVIGSIKTHCSLLFDGYPRTTGQAEFAINFLELHHYQIIAILLRLDDHTCIERILDRRICSKCHTTIYPKDAKHKSCPICDGKLIKREDDTRENAITRLKTYHKETDPVVSYFHKHKKLIEIDGRPDIETVRQSIFSQLEE